MLFGRQKARNSKQLPLADLRSTRRPRNPRTQWQETQFGPAKPLHRYSPIISHHWHFLVYRVRSVDILQFDSLVR